jgi:hypothetical protein
MVGEGAQRARGCRRFDRDRRFDREGRIGVDPPERPSGSGDLGLGGRLPVGEPFPRDEDAAGPEQRQAELNEVRQRRDRPGGHGGPRFTIACRAAKRLRSRGLRDDGAREADRLDGRRQEPDLLADGVDEDGTLGRKRGRKGNAGKPTAAAQIDELVDAATAQDRERRQAVDDVADRDRLGLPDRGQVDRDVPGEEQPDMAIDGGTDRGRQLVTETRQTGVERAAVLSREGWTVADARRERASRTVQALLLSVVPRAIRAPLPASSFPHTAGRPVCRDSSGSRPGLPVPLASPDIRGGSVRMPDGRRRGW